MNNVLKVLFSLFALFLGSQLVACREMPQSKSPQIAARAGAVDPQDPCAHLDGLPLAQCLRGQLEIAKRRPFSGPGAGAVQATPIPGSTPVPILGGGPGQPVPHIQDTSCENRGRVVEIHGQGGPDYIHVLGPFASCSQSFLTPAYIATPMNTGGKTLVNVVDTKKVSVAKFTYASPAYCSHMSSPGVRCRAGFLDLDGYDLVGGQLVAFGRWSLSMDDLRIPDPTGRATKLLASRGFFNSQLLSSGKKTPLIYVFEDWSELPAEILEEHIASLENSVKNVPSLDTGKPSLDDRREELAKSNNVPKDG